MPLLLSFNPKRRITITDVNRRRIPALAFAAWSRAKVTNFDDRIAQHDSRFTLKENSNVEHTRRIIKASQAIHGKDLGTSASVELASMDNKGGQDAVPYHGIPQSMSRSQNLYISKSSGPLEVLASYGKF
jgi:hypothetical protein